MHNDQPAQPAAQPTDDLEVKLFKDMLHLLHAQPVPVHSALNVLATLYREILMRAPEQYGGALAFCGSLAHELLQAAGQQTQAAQALQAVAVLGTMPAPGSSSKH